MLPDPVPQLQYRSDYATQRLLLARVDQPGMASQLIRTVSDMARPLLQLPICRSREHVCAVAAHCVRDIGIIRTFVTPDARTAAVRGVETPLPVHSGCGFSLQDKTVLLLVMGWAPKSLFTYIHARQLLT